MLSTWESLVSQDKDVQRLGFLTFASAFGPKFERWLSENGFCPADAREVAHDCTVEVLLRVELFRPSEPLEAKFRAWGWTVARNAAEDWRRKYRPEWMTTLPDNAPDAAFQAPEPPDAELSLQRESEIEAATERLRSLLDRLPPIYREVVESRDLEGETTFAEVGRALGISETLARVRYHRAMKILRGMVSSETAV